jgi:hypothetical protein
MNTRCYRCGWSFTLSRETVEAAAISSAGDKAHVVHCPRCRQAIRIPMDQIMRSLPPGWQRPVDTTPPAAQASAVPGSETARDDQPEAAAAATPHTGRRHRHSGKTSTTQSGKSAAQPAAKLSTHQRS